MYPYCTVHLSITRTELVGCRKLLNLMKETWQEVFRELLREVLQVKLTSTCNGSFKRKNGRQKDISNTIVNEDNNTSNFYPGEVLLRGEHDIT